MAWRRARSRGADRTPRRSSAPSDRTSFTALAPVRSQSYEAGVAGSPFEETVRRGAHCRSSRTTASTSSAGCACACSAVSSYWPACNTWGRSICAATKRTSSRSSPATSSPAPGSRRAGGPGRAPFARRTSSTPATRPSAPSRPATRRCCGPGFAAPQGARRALRQGLPQLRGGLQGARVPPRDLQALHGVVPALRVGVREVRGLRRLHALFWRAGSPTV